jgi:hypothetical protein
MICLAWFYWNPSRQVGKTGGCGQQGFRNPLATFGRPNHLDHNIDLSLSTKFPVILVFVGWIVAGWFDGEWSVEVSIKPLTPS